MTTRIAILAAGQGKRMGLPIPKVLVPLHGTPLITRLLKSVKESGVDPRPVIVVSPTNKEEIRKEIGDNYEFAIQHEQRGTGHAVLYAFNVVNHKADALVVLNGDMPFIKPETIKNLVKQHSERRPAMTLITNRLPNFEGEYAAFHDFGRIVRDAGGNIQRIVEKKDATDAEKNITEVNSSYFCFDMNWLSKNLPKLGTNNAQKEYYITDLVKIAIEQDDKVDTINAGPNESIGINTPEHLEHAHKIANS